MKTQSRATGIGPLGQNASDMLVVSQLSIERCQTYITHLHAVMYLCDPEDMGLDSVAAENAKTILSAMNQELALSARALHAYISGT